MKRIGKWLLGLITSALTLVLVIVLLPYAAKWVARIMPDESAAAIRASVVLSQKLEQSAKLETLHVTEELRSQGGIPRHSGEHQRRLHL